MKSLIHDVWADLREKRLVPVAAALAVALLAVPLLLIQPSEEAQPAKAVPASSTKQLQAITSKALVQPADSAIDNGSALDAFLEKNPFEPVDKLEDEAEVASQSGGAKGGDGGSAGTGDLASTGGSGGGLPGGGGGMTPPTQSPTVPVPPLRQQPKPKPKKYTYVVDLSIDDGDRPRSLRSFERLGVLPSQANPLLVFLGVSASGDEAGFMVDSSVQTSGEGRCTPADSECAIVYVEAGAEQVFTDADGKSFTLRVDQIRRVPLSKVAAAAAGRPVARTANGEAPRRFSPPVFSDFEIGVAE